MEPLYPFAITDGRRFVAFDEMPTLPAVNCFFDAVAIISQPTDPHAIGYAPLSDPSRYLNPDHRGIYKYPVHKALAYVTQDGIADASAAEYRRIAKKSLRQMLESSMLSVPAPVHGSAPLAHVLIKLPRAKKAQRPRRKKVIGGQRTGATRNVVNPRRVVHMDGDWVL